MKTSDGKRITPLHAAKLAFLAFGNMAECDVKDALDFVDVERGTAREQAIVCRHLRKIGRRVKKMLGV